MRLFNTAPSSKAWVDDTALQCVSMQQGRSLHSTSYKLRAPNPHHAHPVSKIRFEAAIFTVKVYAIIIGTSEGKRDEAK